MGTNARSQREDHDHETDRHTTDDPYRRRRDQIGKGAGYALTDAGEEAIGIDDNSPKPEPGKSANLQGDLAAIDAELGKSSRKAKSQSAEAVGENRTEALANAESLKRQIAAGEIRASEKRLAGIAEAGILPPTPIFASKAGKPYLKRLADIDALVQAGDAKALRAISVTGVNSFSQRLEMFRKFAILAIEKAA